LFEAGDLQFRIELADPERDIQTTLKLITSQHPKESSEHVILRVLAHCLFYEPGLRFAPGFWVPEAPDLWVKDESDHPLVWVECGHAEPSRLRHVLQHHRRVRVRLLFDEDAAWQAFKHDVATMKHRPPGFAGLDIRKVDPEWVRQLAASDLQRHRWRVTLVGDHIYLEAEGTPSDTPVDRLTLPSEIR